MSLWRDFKLWRNRRRKRRAASFEKLDTDYSYYEELKSSGKSASEAADIARDSGKDWTFQVRMSRKVYGLSLVEAQKIIMLDRDPHLRNQ